MSSKIQMVVFDMAGTTVNENNLVYKILRKAVNDEGFAITLDQVLTEGAGKEKQQAIRSILWAYQQIFDESMTTKIYNRFIILLKNAYATEDILPQPNSEDLLRKLKELNIYRVLNTGYDRSTAESILTKLGWNAGAEYDLLITASDVKNYRPEPDMIFLAMKKLKVSDGNSVVKVGDSIIDIEEGKNAGCALSIGITTGAHSTEQLLSAQPDSVINNLSELLPLI